MSGFRPAPSLLLLALAGCGGEQAPQDPIPVDDPARNSERVELRDATPTSGIDFVHGNGFTPEHFMVEQLGSGVAVIDFDGDGLRDLYFVDSGPVPARTSEQGPGGNRLYRNLGGLRFEDVTARAGVAGRGYGHGAVVGDYDGDGDPDLYVTSYGSNLLYRNEGDGTFLDVTAAAGADDVRWSTGAAFLDYDLDGDLDLLVQNYVAYRVEDHLVHHQAELVIYPTPELFDPVSCSLLRNRGDGTFEDVSEETGIGGTPGKGLGLLVADFDDDGDPDVYCANDLMANYLFENDGGSFREVALVAGVGYSEEGREEAGMGVDAADIDGDQGLDIVVTNFQTEPNSIYRHDGGLFFTEISARTGTAQLARKHLGFGVRWFDLDNDGLQDLVVANGHVYENAPQVDGSQFAQPPLLFRGLGGARFESIGPQQPAPFAQPRVGRGLAVADLDDDGDLDLVITHLGGPPILFENRGGARRSWVTVEAVGRERDGTAIGARIAVTAGGRRQFNEVRSGGSFLSQSDLRLSFGLGPSERLERLEVRWPGGAVQTFEDLPARRHYVVVEGQGLRE